MAQRKLSKQVASAGAVDDEDTGQTEVVTEKERDQFGAIDCRGALQLKPDFAARPIFVTPDGHIFLETFSPIYKQAYDFLIAIAEPVSRPAHVHEYRLTSHSLYAAASVGLQTANILEYLDRLCKTNIPKELADFIEEFTSTYGKVQLVLKDNRYFIESSDPKAMQTLLQDRIIEEARIKTADGALLETAASSARDITIAGVGRRPAAEPGEVSDDLLVAAATAAEQQMTIPSDLQEYMALVEGDEERTAGNVPSFEIPKEHVEVVQRQCSELDYPLLAEYDFKHDSKIPNMKIDLKPSCVLRPYQEKSLRKMFGNGRARSGMIVLPCGAGKTLTGVTACCTVKKRTVVVCTSGVAVEQWRSEFLRWCDVDPQRICCFTADHRAVPPPNSVVICTYSMLAQSGKRAPDAEKVVEYLRSQEWGLMILDEVQTLPAATFRGVLTAVASHCKLGLTATLVREDDKIGDLRFLIGPKLYEANWMDLQANGYIAMVLCSEVWCPMTPAFFKEYLNEEHKDPLRRKLFWCNPNKWKTCDFLIRRHEADGDKIIVFSDDVFVLRELAKRLQRPYLDGETPQREKITVLQQFKTNPRLRTIFCSKIADNSFDIPEANVLIQVSSHGGSRRQEAQRLGRILRAKKASRRIAPGTPNAFFYSIVSCDTREMAFIAGRQRFLADQGYAYKVIPMSTLESGMAEEAKGRPLICSTDAEQQELLCQVLSYRLDTAIEAAAEEGGAAGAASGGSAMRKRTTGMSALTGADDMVYSESKRAKTKPSAVFKRMQQGR